MNRSREAQDTARVGRPRDGKQQTKSHELGALGRPSRPNRPAAGEIPQGPWSEPGKAALGTMANVTRSHGSNR